MVYCIPALKGEAFKRKKVKWSSLRKREAEKALRSLEGKSRSVRTGAPEKALGLVAKNVEDAEKLREEGFIVFELGEMF